MDKFELIEDLETMKKLINLERLRGIYTNYKVKDLPEDPKEQHQVLLNDLYKLRENH